MNTLKHIALGAAVGAAAATLPDAALYCFGWRRDWLPESHPLVRVHRALHRPSAIVAVAIVVGVASHVIADLHSTHRERP